jgi:ribonuclease P protein component
MKSRTPRRGRLSRSAEFERVYRQGRSCANRQLVLYSFPNPVAERPRMGLSVSRKVGGAVERNRIKRLLREAFAQAEGELQGGHDLVVVARPGICDFAEREGLTGVGGALTELLEKAGLRAEGAPGLAGGEGDPAGGEGGLAGEEGALAGGEGGPAGGEGGL